MINFFRFSFLVIMSYFSISNIASAKNLILEDVSFEDINGNDVKLSDLPGKIILVVNTASFCGFTKQYKGLQELTNKFSSEDLSIIAIPSNDFGRQEPGNNKEIKDFCETNFGINFPMSEKTDVIGSNAHPFYKWAKSDYGIGAIPKWNFHKIIIAKNGKISDTFASFTKPSSKKFLDAIEKEIKN